MAPSSTTSHRKKISAESYSTIHNHWQHHRYRWLTGLVVLLALGLAFIPTHDQRRLRMPDPWAYELATQNFAQGKWILTNDEVAAARTALDLRGGRLTQYIQTEPNNWTFRQSPGHPLQMALFLPSGRPQLANVLLVMLTSVILYTLLTARYSERLAFVGVAILLWTPITLTALHYYNMDTFSGAAWPLIGGGLLLLYENKKGQGRWLPLLVLAAGFALGWAVVARITNIFLLGLCGLYFLLLLWQFWPYQKYKRKVRHQRRRPRQRTFPFLNRIGWLHMALFGLGCILALSILALYNRASFGHFFDSGYFYSNADDRFYLWNENPTKSVAGGVETWLAGGTVFHILITLAEHVRLWLRPATLAWPLWPLAIYGLIY
ncbi:MAG: hypothetical protein GY796_36780, partial [Chloroflexi bacterium]|nr:hypothetical protein [Chloroflexota bacterium]